ncbi:hypothetical protein B0H19DRAFT_1379488 [Mycena capillaripes]|nr:hypothetical protein B0H19DRAFT_1379488 [Mycena capillaripes]
MWTKLSSALKSKQAQDGEVNNVSEQALAGPSSSPSKRKGVFHRDDGSLRLNSPLKLPSIPQKVKSTFNLHGNSSQLTLTPQTLPESNRSVSRRSSQEVLGTTTSRPKAARRSSFNLLTRRPSLDLLRSPPETPRSPRIEEPSTSPNSNGTRGRAATFGGSVRSILREPNTPGAAKNVRFFARDADTVTPEQSAGAEPQPVISRSTPPEDTFMSGSTSSAFGQPRFASSSRRSSRPSVAEIFSPPVAITDSPVRQGKAPHLMNFFDELDVAPISSLSTGLHVPNSDLPDALTSTPYRDGGKDSNGDAEIGPPNSAKGSTQRRSRNKPPQLSISHDRSASFSFAKSAFRPIDDSDSKRSSSGKSSSISDTDSIMTSSSSSPSLSRSRSISDTVFMSMMRGSSAKALETTSSSSSDLAVQQDRNAAQPDPFSANATTYYTPQTMIPTTPPKGESRHVRRASKEESIIFSLKAQLDLQTELCGQFKADLRSRDELVEMLVKRLAEADEEDAKKRKFLKSWKKKVAELEKTCRFLEDELEGSRQQSMERSVMDEASSEALRMLHRQISELEREKGGWKRTESVLREEVRRLETLAGERRNEAARLRESLGSLSQKDGKQKEQERMVEEALKCTVAALEKSSEEEKQRHNAFEMGWQVENEALRRDNVGLVNEREDFQRQLMARDDEIAALKAELSVTRDRADKAAKSFEATEAGKCALAMERDSLKLQVIKLQEKKVVAEVAEQKVLELEDDLQGLWDVKSSLEKERDQLKEQIREEQGRVEDDTRRRELEATEDSRRNLERATAELREQMGRMQREQSAALESALQDGTRKQLEIDGQTTTLVEFKAEIERLKDQTRELQQESADKEVRIVQIMKQRAQDKQDLEGLNVALDSKQQELELLKRRLAVRGTAGNTASQSSKPAPQRRESVSATPRMSRPSSITSEFGVDLARERKPSAEGSTKIPALNKSTRLNSSTTIAPPPSKRGSMGPPPLRSRSSIVGTPSSTPRTLTRSSSATVATSVSKAKVPKSPTTANPTSPVTTQGEKENASVLTASRRLSRIPTFSQ